VTTHQIVSDGWSVGVMAREMGVIYDALRHHKPAPLDPLTIQYADYSLWQLEWLRVRGTVAETEYWARQLAGVKPFKVIADRPRPAMPTTNGVIVSRLLPRDLTNRAQALCTEHGATLFAAALGALCAMLARYTRQNEIVLGTQVSDRNQVELEGGAAVCGHPAGVPFQQPAAQKPRRRPRAGPKPVIRGSPAVNHWRGLSSQVRRQRR